MWQGSVKQAQSWGIGIVESERPARVGYPRRGRPLRPVRNGLAPGLVILKSGAFHSLSRHLLRFDGGFLGVDADACIGGPIIRNDFRPIYSRPRGLSSSVNGSVLQGVHLPGSGPVAVGGSENVMRRSKGPPPVRQLLQSLALKSLMH